MKNTIIVLLQLLMACSIYGQDLTDQIKTFQTLQLNVRLNSKDKLNLSYTGIADVGPLKYNYHQFGIGYTRRLTKKWDGSFNIDKIEIFQRGDQSFKDYLRLGTEFSYDTRIKKINVTHSGSVEAFFPRFSKYQTRWMYDLELGYRKSFTKFKIRPYSQFRVYYYSGGDLINYYEDGALVARKAPNDIHRWRWYIGVKTNPVENLIVNVAFLHNEEFNAGINRNSNINIYNKNKTGIKLPYNSYNAIQLTLVYQLRLSTLIKKNKEINKTEIQ